MQELDTEGVDFILTDPPYLVKYRSRDGRTVTNDDISKWLLPAFREMHRVLRRDAFCVVFFGWTQGDKFISAIRQSGLNAVGHIVFQKKYASKVRFLRHQHEQALLLIKGRPPAPQHPLPDILQWKYSGNRFHPTQKPVQALLPLVDCFSRPGDLVLDPFCGSGSSLVAAKARDRRVLGIELDPVYAQTAVNRLNGALDCIAA